MTPKKIQENKMILFTVEEELYDNRKQNLLQRISEPFKKICYICLNSVYDEMILELRKASIPSEKFFFIDILSEHYISHEKVSNCIFINEVPNIKVLEKLIESIVEQEKCDAIVIDTATALLHYEESSNIIRLIHRLKCGELSKKLKNIKQTAIISLSGDQILTEIYSELTKDLSMFADEVINLNNQKKKN